MNSVNAFKFRIRSRGLKRRHNAHFNLGHWIKRSHPQTLHHAVGISLTTFRNTNTLFYASTRNNLTKITSDMRKPDSRHASKPKQSCKQSVNARSDYLETMGKLSYVLARFYQSICNREIFSRLMSTLHVDNILKVKNILFTSAK